MQSLLSSVVSAAGAAGKTNNRTLGLIVKGKVDNMQIQ